MPIYLTNLICKLQCYTFFQTPKPQDSDKVPVTVEPTLNQEPEPLQQEIEQDLDDDEEESIEEQFQVKPSICFQLTHYLFYFEKQYVLMDVPGVKKPDRLIKNSWCFQT